MLKKTDQLAIGSDGTSDTQGKIYPDRIEVRVIYHSTICIQRTFYFNKQNSKRITFFPTSLPHAGIREGSSSYF